MRYPMGSSASLPGLSSGVPVLCTYPTRSSLMSGRYPLHVNTENNPASKPGGVDLRMTLISEKLKALGYFTGVSGKWHAGGHVSGQLPINRGFDRSLLFLNGNEDHYTHWFGIDSGFDMWQDDANLYDNTTYGGFLYTRHALQTIAEFDPKKHRALFFNGGEVSTGGNNWPLRGGKYTDFEGGNRNVAFAAGGWLAPELRGAETDELLHVADIWATFSSLAGDTNATLDAKTEAWNAAAAAGDMVPPPDSFDASAVFRSKGGRSGRSEVALSSTALIIGDHKIVQDANAGGKNIWMTPDYPAFDANNSKSPVEIGPACKPYCIFNLSADPQERHDLSDTPEGHAVRGSGEAHEARPMRGLERGKEARDAMHALNAADDRAASAGPTDAEAGPTTYIARGAQKAKGARAGGTLSPHAVPYTPCAAAAASAHDAPTMTALTNDGAHVATRDETHGSSPDYEGARLLQNLRHPRLLLLLGDRVEAGRQAQLNAQMEASGVFAGKYRRQTHCPDAAAAREAAAAASPPPEKRKASPAKAALVQSPIAVPEPVEQDLTTENKIHESFTAGKSVVAAHYTKVTEDMPDAKMTVKHLRYDLIHHMYSEDELREPAGGAGIQHGRITKMQTPRERLAQHFAELLPERDDA
eukprot:g2840.t1